MEKYNLLNNYGKYFLSWSYSWYIEESFPKTLYI